MIIKSHIVDLAYLVAHTSLKVIFTFKLTFNKKLVKNKKTQLRLVKIVKRRTRLTPRIRRDMLAKRNMKRVLGRFLRTSCQL